MADAMFASIVRSVGRFRVKEPRMAVSGTEFVPVDEAARRLKVSRPAMRRRVSDARLVMWTDPSDHRRRMIRGADLELLATPQPFAAREEGDLMPA